MEGDGAASLPPLSLSSFSSSSCAVGRRASGSLGAEAVGGGAGSLGLRVNSSILRRVSSKRAACSRDCASVSGLRGAPPGSAAGFSAARRRAASSSAARRAAKRRSRSARSRSLRAASLLSSSLRAASRRSASRRAAATRSAALRSASRRSAARRTASFRASACQGVDHTPITLVAAVARTTRIPSTIRNRAPDVPRSPRAAVFCSSVDCPRRCAGVVPSGGGAEAGTGSAFASSLIRASHQAWSNSRAPRKTLGWHRARGGNPQSQAPGCPCAHSRRRDR